VLSSAHADAVGAALVTVTDSGSVVGVGAPFFFLYNVMGDWGLLFTGPAPAQAHVSNQATAAAAVVDWSIHAEEAPQQLTITSLFGPKYTYIIIRNMAHGTWHMASGESSKAHLHRSIGQL